MSDALDLFGALTQLQQQVVTNVLRGMSQRQAYMHAPLGKAKTGTSIDTSASDVMRNPKVQAYVACIQGAEHDDTIMGRDEMRRRLSAIARTDIVDLVELQEYESGKSRAGEPTYQTSWAFRDDARRDPLRMSAVSELTVDKQGCPKVKLHSALQAMKQLAEMDGLEAPKRSEVTGAGGKPITVASISAATPQEAAKLYARLMDLP